MARIDALPAPQAHALRASLALEAAPAGGLDRFAVGAAMLSLLAGVAEDTGVAVLVDDLHWLDRPSAEAIVFAARRLAHDRAACPVRGPRRRGSPRRPLGPDRGAGHAARPRRHGRPRSAGPRRSGHREIADAIFGTTCGNPLAIREFRDLDAVALPSGPAPVSRRIESTYGTRAAALSREGRLALVVVAADDRLTASTLRVALSTLGVDDRGVEEAEAAGLLVRTVERVGFRHPLVRSAVFHQALDGDRRRAHAAIAAALTAEADRDRRALHRAAAAVGRDEGLAEELETIAADALARHAYAAAAAAGQRGAELAAGPLRLRCLMTAARGRWLSGDTDRAATLLEEALAASPDPDLRADLERLRAEFLQQTGHLSEAIELLVDEARRVAPSDRRRASAMLEDAARAAMYDGRAETAIAAADEALEIGVGGAGQPKALALVLAGRFDEAVPLFEAALAAAAPDDPRAVSASSDWAGWLCRYGEAYRHAVRAVELARVHGSPVAAAKATQVACDQAGVAGDLAASIAYGDDGIAIGRETGQALMVVWCNWSLGAAFAWRGDARGVARATEGMARAGRPVSWGAVRHAAAVVRGIHLLAMDDPEAAAGVLDGAADLDAEQVGNAPISVAFDLIEAWRKTGRTASSERALDRVAAHAHQPWAAAALLRSRGLHATSADGDGLFQAALERAEQQCAWIEHARTQLLYGRVAAPPPTSNRCPGAAPCGPRGVRADGQRTRWRRRPLRELAATGETHAVRREGRPVETLTPQEYRVAAMAADGLANRDIAQRLFLSPKTIEAHLHRVFVKLGVDRRHDLGRALEDGGAGHD